MTQLKPTALAVGFGLCCALAKDLRHHASLETICDPDVEEVDHDHNEENGEQSCVL